MARSRASIILTKYASDIGPVAIPAAIAGVALVCLLATHPFAEEETQRERMDMVLELLGERFVSRVNRRIDVHIVRF